jgi:hypothetical protein
MIGPSNLPSQHIAYRINLFAEAKAKRVSIQCEMIRVPV